MDMQYLIQCLENRIKTLQLVKDQAFMSGDLNRINEIDADLQTTITTLEQLKKIQL